MIGSKRKRRLFAVIILGCVAALDYTLVESGIFNNIFDHKAAMAEHSRAWSERIGVTATREDIFSLFQEDGGSCEGNVRRYVLDDTYRSSAEGAVFCTADQTGRLPLFFASHRWSCAFEPINKDNMILVGCQRADGIM